MESLANLHRFTALTDEFDYSTLKASTPAYTVESNTFAQLGSESLRYQSRVAETTAFRNLQQHSSAPVSVSHNHHNDAVHFLLMTDLRMIRDKGTEDWATYPSKSRGRETPVELLKQYVLTTGRKPRYLRVDNAKEFTSQEMADYCKDNNIILQPVVAYNHTMQKAWREPLADLSNTAVLLSSAPTSPPVSGLTLDFTYKIDPQARVLNYCFQ